MASRDDDEIAFTPKDSSFCTISALVLLVVAYIASWPSQQ
jgi:hypothetical protein